MVKKILLALSLCVGLHSQSAFEKASEFVDKNRFESSKNLISFLFADSAKYYNKNGDLDSILILKTLKNNGLLDLSMKEPQDLELVFTTNQNPLIFMRVITESLNSMGYNFLMTKRVLKTPHDFTWRIALSTQSTPNPIVLNDILKAHGCVVLDVEKHGYNWIYTIDSQSAKIDAVTVEPNKKIELKKPFAPYLLALNSDTKMVVLSSHVSDHWYPKVSFYSNNLHLIKVVNVGSRQSVLRLKVPENAFYLKIDDKYTLDNIKRGISVTFEQ